MTDMKKINQLHDEAMDLASQAFMARRQNDKESFQEYARQAFEKESAAANLIAETNIEPSRSILHRSAATLAMDCGELREAEKLIAIALSGNPPPEIADELRDLLEQVNFQRHLDLKGVELETNEVQISVAGSAVGYGLVLSELVLSRLKDLEKLIYRTIEHRAGKDYRRAGSPSKEIKEGYGIYLSAPRAGSFAMTIKLGKPKQPRLPGFDNTHEIIEEVIYQLELINNKQADILKDRIANTAYFKSFVSLARNIAPDGDDVKLVGLTSFRNGETKTLSFTTPQAEIEVDVEEEIEVDEEIENITLFGTLRAADGTKSDNQIKLVTEDNQKYTIVVQEGLDDIVTSLWNEDVKIEATKRGGSYYMRDILKIR